MTDTILRRNIVLCPKHKNMGLNLLGKQGGQPEGGGRKIQENEGCTNG